MHAPPPNLWPFLWVRWGLLEGFERRRDLIRPGFDSGCWVENRMQGRVEAGLAAQHPCRYLMSLEARQHVGLGSSLSVQGPACS